MPTTKALLTIIEEYLEEQITDFAGVSGADHDPDLPAGQRLKLVTSGYLLDHQNYRKGPALSLAVYRHSPFRYEVGGGPDNVSDVEYYFMKIVAVTAPTTNRKTAKAAAALLDYIVQTRLMNLDLSPLTTADTDYQKEQYVNDMSQTDAIVDISMTGQEAAETIAYFAQEWVLTVEVSAGDQD